MKRFWYHIKSFGYAFTGLRILLGERNAQLHAIATLLVIVAGFWRGLTTERWCILFFAIAFVWIAEALNTALEYLCNKVSPEYDPFIKKAKDVSAAAVLIAAILAIVIGALVFFC